MMFDLHTIEQHAQALANYLPNGRLFEAKNINDSLMRMYLRGLAHANQDAESFLILFEQEMDVSNTTLFIEEWERTVGIPDDCFNTNTTIEIRRQQVLMKLASLGVQTEADFVNLAAIYGVTITIYSGIKYNAFPITFPIILFDSAKEARFNMVVEYFVEAQNRFTYTFPIVFGDQDIPIIECLFRKLIPANVDLYFLQSDAAPTPPNTGSFSFGFSEGFEIY